MTITASYPGKCARCGGGIRPGQQIEWQRGQKPYHTACPSEQEPVAHSNPYVPAGVKAASERQIALIERLNGDTKYAYKLTRDEASAYIDELIAEDRKRQADLPGEDVVPAGRYAIELDDGQMVIITDDDIATLPEERSREIEVLEFVPASEVDPMLFDRSYFLEPDSKSSKSYVLLAKTLAESDRMAIVHFTLRNKTRLAALRVKDFGKRDVMVVHTLLWPDEIRDPDFPILDKKVEIKPAELKMAGQVVESMAEDFNPDRYHDTYQEQLQELVDAKLEGGEAFTTEEQPKELDETEDVSDLLAKLEASVKARSGNGKAPAKKAAPKKAPAKKTAAKKAPAKKAPAKKASSKS